MIEVKNLSKEFEIFKEKRTSLYDFISLKNKKSSEKIWALKNVNFKLKKGKILGVIGKNGSGKSTLLKILAGILQPTEGSISIKGKVLPFIELGIGFESELTGIENIHLYGSILGLTKSEIDQKINSVINFADIGHFIHAKLKTYSSGMIARLAFSTSLMVEPDILLVDEILSIGDEKFQRKSVTKMLKFKEEGKTIIFASHDMNQIRSVCDKCILLDQGQIKKLGKVSSVVDAYCPKIDYHPKREKKGKKNIEKKQEEYKKPVMDLNKNIGLPARLKQLYQMIGNQDYRNIFDSNNLSKDTKQKSLYKDFITALNLLEKKITISRDRLFIENVLSELKEILCGAIAEKERLIEFCDRVVIKTERTSRDLILLKKEKKHLEKKLISIIKNDKIRPLKKNNFIIKRVEFIDGNKRKTTSFKTGDEFKIEIYYQLKKEIKNPICGIALLKTNGLVVLGPNTYTSEVKIKTLKKDGLIRYTIQNLPLLQGYYLVSINIHDKNYKPYNYLNKKFVIKVLSKKGFGSVIAEHTWEVK